MLRDAAVESFGGDSDSKTSLVTAAASATHAMSRAESDAIGAIRERMKPLAISDFMDREDALLAWVDSLPCANSVRVIELDGTNNGCGVYSSDNAPTVCDVELFDVEVLTLL